MYIHTYYKCICICIYILTKECIYTYIYTHTFYVLYVCIHTYTYIHIHTLACESVLLRATPPLNIVMVNNWSILSADSKKTCKLAFEQGMIQDGKPEVQHLAKAGMVSYLSMKPSKELKIVAEAYIKNSEALADRYHRCLCMYVCMYVVCMYVCMYHTWLSNR